MTTDRADRAAFGGEDAAAELHRLVSEGELEPRATNAVLAAAGHGEEALRRAKRSPVGISSCSIQSSGRSDLHREAHPH